MINHTAIVAAFRSRLDTVTGLPANIASENVDFEPPEIDKQNPTNSLWIREDHLPGNEEWVANRLVEMNGVMQFTIFGPSGISTEAIDSLALNIANKFEPSTKLGGILTVVRTDRLKGTPEDQWFSKIIRVSYRTHSNLT